MEPVSIKRSRNLVTSVRAPVSSHEVNSTHKIAATDGIGWPVDHLSKECSGFEGGLSVTRKGSPFSLMFCTFQTKENEIILNLENVEPISDANFAINSPEKIPCAPCSRVFGHEFFVTVEIPVEDGDFGKMKVWNMQRSSLLPPKSMTRLNHISITVKLFKNITTKDDMIEFGPFIWMIEIFRRIIPYINLRLGHKQGHLTYKRTNKQEEYNPTAT
ncbi:transducin/WD40 repeat-like superfamily protein [Striga asiatica]|uniref:Transducin/WD40 repeat-like superfamily protein n=1 Tax=Striga asiatica TaxID=4170 RepID=A0A5A7Q8V9_STRAF|nr:transducin/WD40 repeat-like superfamily protein [Striga asiatica]